MGDGVNTVAHSFFCFNGCFFWFDDSGEYGFCT